MNEIVKKNAVKYGIIIGLIMVLINVGMYVIDMNLFGKWWIGILNMILAVGIGIYAMVLTKKELNNNYSFKDAFSTYFFYAVIGIAISVIFQIILFNYVDPAAQETLKEVQIKTTVEMLQKFNTPTNAIKEAIKNIEESNQYAPLEQLKGMFIAFAVSGIFAAILGAIFKSKPKEQF